MDVVAKVLFCGIALFIMWGLYKGIKANPEWVSKENLTKSFGTMGFVALFLIAVIAFCVMSLRTG